MTTNPYGPRRTGSLGCMGVLSIICLLVCSGVISGALRWLNPDWVDNRAFWRGPIHSREEVDWKMTKAGYKGPDGWHGGDDLTVGKNRASKPRKMFTNGGGAVIEFPAPVNPDQFRATVAALNPVARRAPDRMHAVGVLSLEPDGAKFAQPVKVTFPLAEAQRPGDVLHVLTRTNAQWQDEGVTARVNADGKSATAEVRHFSDDMLSKAKDFVVDKAVDTAVDKILDGALASGDKWDPDFIGKLQKQSLVGIARINLVLQILNRQDGPLTQDQINQVWATDSSDATELLDDMHGWVKKANPAFANFLVMMQLAHGANWEPIKHFGEPSWEWVKAQYFNEQNGKPPEIKPAWKERLGEATKVVKTFDVVWKVYYRQKKKEILAEYAAADEKDLALKVMQRYMQSQGRSYAAVTVPVIPLTAPKSVAVEGRVSGFDLNVKDHTITLPGHPNLKLDLDFYGLETEPAAVFAHANAVCKTAGETLADWTRKWERGELGSDVAATDLQVLAEFIAGEAGDWKNSCAAAGPLAGECRALTQDLSVKYDWGARLDGDAPDDPPSGEPVWHGYWEPKDPFVEIMAAGRPKSGVREITIAGPTSPLDATLHIEGRKLEADEYLQVIVPEGYEVWTAVGEANDGIFSRTVHKVMPANRIVPPIPRDKEKWRVDIAVRPTAYVFGPSRAVHVTVILKNKDPFEGHWTGKVNLIDGSLADPVSEFMDMCLAAEDAKVKKDIAAEAAEKQAADLAAWERQKTEMVIPAMNTIKATMKGGEWLARFPGIPLEFDIEKDPVSNDDTMYLFQITRAGYTETHFDAPLPVKRVGEFTLEFLPPKDNDSPTYQPPAIRLHRDDDVRETYTFDQKMEAKNIHCELRWVFERTGESKLFKDPGW